jgi:hypothetical protein
MVALLEGHPELHTLMGLYAIVTYFPTEATLSRLEGAMQQANDEWKGKVASGIFSAKRAFPVSDMYSARRMLMV